MNDQNLWQSLVAAALLGTDRQNELPKPNDSTIGTFLTQLPEATTETTLLSRAAALNLYSKAGQKPLTVSAQLPIACEGDDLPVCRRRALSYLHQTLQSDRKAQLPECLRLIAQARWRIPERSLPRLLAVGAKQPDLRPLILPVLGKRGHWLAQQLNLGSDSVIAQDASIWETGTKAQRVQYLAELRSQQPAQAREQLEQTLRQENAQDRAKFLKTLQIGLSDTDRLFLETCLCDRSQEVQKVAISLLIQLPQSSLCQQALALIKTAIIDNRPTQGTVDLIPSQQWSESVSLLKLAALPPSQNLGQSATELAGILSWVPLQSWVEQFNITLTEFIGCSAQSTWHNAIQVGLVQAVLNQHNADMAAELIHAGVESAESLFTLLNYTQANQLLHHFSGQNNSEQAWQLLTHCTCDWSSASTTIAIPLIAEKLTSHQKRWTVVQWLKDNFANQVDVSHGDAIASLRALNIESSLKTHIDQVCQILTFRMQMIQALKPDSG
jgi:Family of unknown function (DUF5691)